MNLTKKNQKLNRLKAVLHFNENKIPLSVLLEKYLMISLNKK